MRWVSGASARASEPTNISPSPKPIASGAPLPGADQQLRMAGEDHGQREGAMQPAQRRARPPRPAPMPAASRSVDQVRRRSRCRSRSRRPAPLRLQLGAQLGVVLDDAVVDHADAPGAVRVGVALGRRAMRRPAGMADAGRAAQRRRVQHRGQVAELALGAAALDMAVDQRGDAGAVIAAIFQAPQRLQQQRRRRRLPTTPTMPHISSIPSSTGRLPLKPLPGLFACRPRAIAIASSGTSSVTTLPAATSALRTAACDRPRSCAIAA